MIKAGKVLVQESMGGDKWLIEKNDVSVLELKTDVRNLVYVLP